jgi:hypothetical protein
MPFRAVSRDRSVGFQVAGIMPFDAALDGVAGGASIVMVELPPQITGEADSELAQELVASILRLLRRRARGRPRPRNRRRRGIPGLARSPDAFGWAIQGKPAVPGSQWARRFERRLMCRWGSQVGSSPPLRVGRRSAATAKLAF